MKTCEFESALQPKCSCKPHEKSFWGRLYGSSKALAISRLAKMRDFPIVVLTGDSQTASRLKEALRFYLDGEVDILSFPDWETLPYDRLSPYQDIISDRLSVLTRLPDLKRGILIAPIGAAMYRLLPRDFLASHRLILHAGQQLDLNQFKCKLNESGYVFNTEVVEHGEAAIRGSLIDLYPMGGDLPLRIDLLDDEIDSIRTFDPNTQRSFKRIDSVTVLPAREIPLTEQGIARFRSAWRARFSGNPSQCPVYREVSDGLAIAGIEYYLPLFYTATDSLFDYVSDQSLVVFDEDALQIAESFWRDFEARYEQSGHDLERPLLPPREIALNPHDLLSRVKRYHQIHLSSAEHDAQSDVINYDTRLPRSLTIDARTEKPLRLFKSFVNDFDGRILIVAESPGRQEALLDLFKQHDINPLVVSSWSAFISGDTSLGLTVAPLEQGAELASPNIAVVSEGQLFGERIMRQRSRKRRRQDPESIIRSLAELTIGAPVVHEQHGVGRYQGLTPLTVDDIPTEFIAIQYADGDKLYLPVSALDLISRYAGLDPEHAPLHRLGSGQWERARQKAERQMHDIAAELLELHAQRMARSGTSFSIDENAYRAFVQGFPFEETPDQASAITSVIDDLQKAKPMDRLVCGDAGFGKTEVAMRASFIVARNYRQVAILVPTTLLAQQHYQNFRDRFADWPVRIELLSRFCTAKQETEILENLQNGKVDIVIGTHKLIGKKIKFDRLGLVIIDEEHRFGVRQKEKFKAMRAEVDMLTLTATPIPRTLNMALSDLRELSIMTTPPSKRLAVKTFIRQWDDVLLKEALFREIKRGGQVYIIYNEVRSIEKMAERIEALLPEISLKVAHGQMPGRLLERIMLDFYHRRFNVLLCTTIVESGIDVPNANTMIVYRADKFGLAQLYQLRGRVGRSHHHAFAYFLVPERKSMTSDAIKRLEAIEALEYLGIGFTLAAHDLEIRGAGEFLGDEQSGHIQQIGYGLYMDLLNRTVSAMRSGRQPQLDRVLDHGTEIDLHLPALIPEDYLPDVHIRLTLYKRIANAESQMMLDDLKMEMVDRFGVLPEFTQNLFRVAELKLIAKPIGVKKIDLGPEGGSIQFHSYHAVDPTKIIHLIQQEPATYALKDEETLSIKKSLPEPSDRLTMVRVLVNDIVERNAAA